jgi:hypothetical protein
MIYTIITINFGLDESSLKISKKKKLAAAPCYQELLLRIVFIEGSSSRLLAPKSRETTAGLWERR